MPDTNTLSPQVDQTEEVTLVQWQAPERAFKTRDKDFWITAIAILVLVSVILFFIKEFFLIMALISVLFLYYVLSTFPPGKVNNRITNRAIYFGETRYEWDVLEKFWFKPSLDTDMVHIGTTLNFPRLISIVVNPKDIPIIKEILLKQIPLIENPPSFIDKLTKWAAERLPLEDRPNRPSKDKK